MAVDNKTSLRNRRRLNAIYLDGINLIHVLLGLLPTLLRNHAYRRLLLDVGTDVFIDRRVYFKFPRLVSIGNRSSINRGVEFYPSYIDKAGISIGDDCYVAPNVQFHAASHRLHDLSEQFGEPIRVGSNVWIGAGAIVLPGVTIDTGAVVGAGSVVTKNVESWTIVGGSPAQKIGVRPQ